MQLLLLAVIVNYALTFVHMIIIIIYVYEKIR